MKRTYVAARLLEHGPLTFAEFWAITGWARSTADWALRELQALGLVVAEQMPNKCHLYRLAAA